MPAVEVAAKEEIPIVKEEPVLPPAPPAEVKEETKAQAEVCEAPAEAKEPVAEEVKPESREEVKEAAKPEFAEVVQPRVPIDIAVPDRVSTGIGSLDSLIGGGFLAGKVYLISGESGTGKTVFSMQFLYQGLILGENGIYISADEMPIHCIVDAKSLGWNFKRYIEERKLGLLDISSYFSDVRAGKGKTIDMSAVATTIARAVKEFNAKRIVLDTVAPLVFGKENFRSIQEYVRHLVLTLEDSLGCTTVITSSIPSGSNALSYCGVEEFVAEGVIVLGTASFNGHRLRTLSVKKMRSTFSDLNDHVFEIMPQRGIIIKW